MAQQRGKQRELADSAKSRAADSEPEFDESTGPIPEMMRRAIALGLTGFFTTEGAVRKALGDTVPKDWTDFLLETSERTRSEFLERLSHEIGRVLESVDVAQVLKQLLEGRTLEVKAQFSLSENPNGTGPAVRFTAADEDEERGDDR